MASLSSPTAFLFSLLLLLLLLRYSLHLTSASHDLTNFTFHGFSPSNFTLDGTASVIGNGLLRITDNTTTMQTSHAILSTPLHFSNPSPTTHDNEDQPLSSFSTTFVFAIVPPYPGVGVFGMAFLLSPRDHLDVGPRAPKYLGLFNDTSDGDASNHIVAVELDLTPNSDLKDINDNHVGIDVNSAVSVASAPAGYYTEKGRLTNLTLISGEPMQVWVDYNSRDEKLYVTLAPLNVTDRPTRPLCSAHVNLTKVLLEDTYLGFSGTAGKGSLTQYVLGWSFRLNGKADPLDLSKLPRLPRARATHEGRPNALMVLLPLAAAAAVVALAIGAAYALWKRMEKYAEVLEEWEHEYGPHRISYRDIYTATKGFRESELLGTGGFGKVYKGVLPRTKAVVAVKKVSHSSKQGMPEFVAEVVSIGRMRHRNLVALLGYCRRKEELLLVYDYMPHGSLDNLLFGNPQRPLDWGTRLAIIKGVAAGLLYLHEEWEQVVLHRDVKASNVLLDENHNGRLGDFGLARLYDHGTAPQTTHVVGTIGYLAPELSREGKASKATDVFAFGVFVMEVVCGRRPIEPTMATEEIVLLDWVVRRWAVEGKKLADAADARMKGTYKDEEVEMVMKLGLLCAHAEEEARPSMRQVVQVLEGDLALPQLPMEHWKGCVGGGRLRAATGGDGKGAALDWTVLSGASSGTVATVATGSMFLSGGR